MESKSISEITNQEQELNSAGQTAHAQEDDKVDDEDATSFHSAEEERNTTKEPKDDEKGERDEAPQIQKDEVQDDQIVKCDQKDIEEKRENSTADSTLGSIKPTSDVKQSPLDEEINLHESEVEQAKNTEILNNELNDQEESSTVKTGEVAKMEEEHINGKKNDEMEDESKQAENGKEVDETDENEQAGDSEGKDETKKEPEQGNEAENKDEDEIKNEPKQRDEQENEGKDEIKNEQRQAYEKENDDEEDEDRKGGAEIKKENDEKRKEDVNRDESEDDEESATDETENEDEEGKEQEEEKGLDEDECKDSPAYIPKQGRFYMHDETSARSVIVGHKSVFADEDEGHIDIENAETNDKADEHSTDQAEIKKPDSKNDNKTRADRVPRWTHDMFDERRQAPKSSKPRGKRHGQDFHRNEGDDGTDQQYRPESGSNVTRHHKTRPDERVRVLGSGRVITRTNHSKTQRGDVQQINADDGETRNLNNYRRQPPQKSLNDEMRQEIGGTMYSDEDNRRTTMNNSHRSGQGFPRREYQESTQRHSGSYQRDGRKNFAGGNEFSYDYTNAEHRQNLPPKRMGRVVGQNQQRAVAQEPIHRQQQRNPDNQGYRTTHHMNQEEEEEEKVEMGGFGRPHRTQGPPVREARFSGAQEQSQYPQSRNDHYSTQQKQFLPPRQGIESGPRNSQMVAGGGNLRGGKGRYGAGGNGHNQYGPPPPNNGRGGNNSQYNRNDYPHPKQPTEPVVFDPLEQQTRRGAPLPPRERRPLPIHSPTHNRGPN